ncbi:hypothetical protein M2347_003174 [Chryseobacterium sp. H1D6B]|nr:hypothetical protein [Chryseobacterium sp. H1D6B]
MITNTIEVGILITRLNCFMVVRTAFKVIESARAPKLHTKYKVTMRVANTKTIKN